jgi:hypothetical protein
LASLSGSSKIPEFANRADYIRTTNGVKIDISVATAFKLETYVKQAIWKQEIFQAVKRAIRTTIPGFAIVVWLSEPASSGNDVIR